MAKLRASVHRALSARAISPRTAAETLVGQFADRRLLDEILVTVAPVTLGRGAPLLPRGLTSLHLELVDVARDRAKLRYRGRR